MTSLSDVKQAEIIKAFKSTSRYFDDLLNIDHPYFEGMVNRIYPPELQLNCFPGLSSATCCSYPRNQNRQFCCNFRTLPGNLPI